MIVSDDRPEFLANWTIDEAGDAYALTRGRLVSGVFTRTSRSRSPNSSRHS